MKKTIFFIALALAVIAGLAAQNTVLPKLAVVEFNTNVSNERTKADALMARNVAESHMIAVAPGKYEIITRTEIDKLIENQRIQVSDISSSENVRRLKLENISYIVTGSLDAIANDYTVTVRVLDVSTGRYSHSANDFMSSGSRELHKGISDLMVKLTSAMGVGEGGDLVRADSASGIAIQVSTDIGGDLYFQGEMIASLFDNDTYTIPIERPGTYALLIILVNGTAKTTSVKITTRGVAKVDFSTIKRISIGDPGPCGGIVFYDKGNNSGGWRYLEAAPASAEFSANWDSAIQRCKSMNYGGFTNWRLPDRNELDLMYKNLKQKYLGGFEIDWYWSSSQASNTSAWSQNFNNGGQNESSKSPTNRVRAVRAF